MLELVHGMQDRSGYDTWADLTGSLVKALRDVGVRQSYQEIWNEPDLTGEAML